MFSSEGGGLPLDSGGIVGNTENYVNQNPYPRPDPRRSEFDLRHQQPAEAQYQDLFYTPVNRRESAEMVAQEMAQGYTQLLHGVQEPQEFMSLEELKPRLHQEHHNLSQNHIQNATTITNTGLYHLPEQQQQSYYNLTSMPE